jgi:hypothetical protein
MEAAIRSRESYVGTTCGVFVGYVDLLDFLALSWEFYGEVENGRGPTVAIYSVWADGPHVAAALVSLFAIHCSLMLLAKGLAAEQGNGNQLRGDYNQWQIKI